MTFNSLEFVLFLPLVVFPYFFVPRAYRWIFLLAASYAFYLTWGAAYLFLLALSSVTGYAAALGIEAGKTPAARRVFLAAGLICAIGVLVLFKYADFISGSFCGMLRLAHVPCNIAALGWVLPAGISFYVFRIVSYLIDVYRGELKAERHCGLFALYTGFFPSVLSGPIDRAGDMLAQFRRAHSFDYERVRDSLALIIWGMFKKVVIADRLAVMVNEVYRDPSIFNGNALMLAGVLFAFQLYCDFSGYTDMARGAARIMGFRLMENFTFPYASRSVTEFWRRWHISLSRWIHDYVYAPLVLTKRSWGTPGVICSLMVAFLLIGIWHGANTTFIVFGLLQGVGVSFEVLTSGWRQGVSQRLPRWLWNPACIVSTFLFWCFSLIFLKASGMEQAFFIIGRIADTIGAYAAAVFSGQLSTAAGMARLGYTGFTRTELQIALMLVFALEGIQFLHRRIDLWRKLKSMPAAVRWLVYYACILSIFFLGVFKYNKFVYLQF